MGSETRNGRRGVPSIPAAAEHERDSCETPLEGGQLSTAAGIETSLMGRFAFDSWDSPREDCDFTDYACLPDDVEELLFDLGHAGLANPPLLNVMRELNLAAQVMPRSETALVGMPPDSGIPAVLYGVDIARVFRKSVQAARTGIKRHAYGPWFYDGRRPAVLRDTMLRHLREKQTPLPDAPPRQKGSERARGYAERITRRVRQRGDK